MAIPQPPHPADATPTSFLSKEKEKYKINCNSQVSKVESVHNYFKKSCLLYNKKI
jgi:hypothetical protein